VKSKDELDKYIIDRMERKHAQNMPLIDRLRTVAQQKKISVKKQGY
jgi:hypothetical protein